MTPKNTSESKKSLDHVAIIMDGNGRWAQERGLARIKGHEEGAQNARRILSVAQKFGIRYITLYAFSTENWQRPRQEVAGLLKLLGYFLKKHGEELIRRGIRVHVIGKYKEMPEAIARALDRLMEDTAHFQDYNVVLAINYSSRSEIVEAVKEMLEAGSEGNGSKLDWERLRGYLYTKDIPDPDLIIRTSGEHRLSNFLLLQGAYSEVYFSSVYWPDFSETHFYEAIEYYKTRERRFGRTSDQLMHPN